MRSLARVSEMPSSTAASLTDRDAFSLHIVLRFSPGTGRDHSPVQRYGEDVFLHLDRIPHRDAGIDAVVLRECLNGNEIVRGSSPLPALPPERKRVRLFRGNLS